MDKCSKQVFPISNYTRWSGRGSKEGKILKQISPLSRQNTRQHSTKWIWNRRDLQLQTSITNTSKYVPEDKIRISYTAKVAQGNCVSSENQLRTKIKSFSWHHFI